MAINVGSYFGAAKESTYGTRVAPAVFLPILKPAKPKLVVPMVNVPSTLNYGDLATVPGIRMAEIGGVELAATPEVAAVALSALIGSPTTSGTNPNLTHTYSPSATATIPAYSFETNDGNGCFAYVGSRLSSLDLSHTPDGFLTATLGGMGKDRSSQTAGTPTITQEFFQQSQLVITYNSADISTSVEDVKVAMKFGKEAHKGFGSASIANVGVDGVGEAIITLRLRYDSSRSADYIAATARALSLVWTISANRSLSLSFANVILTDDPVQQQNDSLGEGRIQLVLRALATSGTLFTAVVKTGLAASNL